jgi:hypothetical protein
VLVRDLGDGRALCIGHASHAWLSGQTARAWDEPLDEAVLLAGAQHDVGMAEWDLAPALDEATGFPVGFMDMALETHLELWTAAPHRLETQSLHAALLVSHHGRRLYERRDLARLSARDAAAARGYLAAQHALQARWTALLALEQARVEHEATLLFAWDALSLGLLLGWAPFDLPGIGVRVEPAGEEDVFRRDPWPLRADAHDLVCEGRVVARGSSARELHEALAAAPPQRIARRLVRRDS